MQCRIDKKQIRNFLTIRYNPLDRPITRPANWRDFQQTESDLDGNTTEKILRESITTLLGEKDGTISISLSSGIDSTLSLELLRKVFPNRKIVAICAIFEGGFDESEIAKKVAEKHDADFKTLHMDSLFVNMPEIIYISKRPKWNTYTHLVAKEAKKSSDVLVTGDGADELFGGYTFRYDKFLNLLNSKDDSQQKVIKYLECHDRDWVPDQPKLFGSSIKFQWYQIYRYFKPWFMNALSPLQQVMLADFNGKLLYDFIPTGRSICNHYKLKGAPIFLYSKLVNYAMHLPIEQKYDHKNKLGKLVLRKITKRLGIMHLDEKIGFSPNLFVDWKKHGREICRSYLLDKNANIFRQKLINYRWVIKAFERVENDGDLRYLNRLISILALEIWYRMFFTKEINRFQRLS